MQFASCISKKNILLSLMFVTYSCTAMDDAPSLLCEERFEDFGNALERSNLQTRNFIRFTLNGKRTKASANLKELERPNKKIKIK